jgi:hypothetical protein
MASAIRHQIRVYRPARNRGGAVVFRLQHKIAHWEEEERRPSAVPARPARPRPAAPVLPAQPLEARTF